MTAARPADAPPPMHSESAHEAIARELVRCTLTGVHRGELSMLPADRAFARLRTFCKDVADGLAALGRALRSTGLR